MSKFIERIHAMAKADPKKVVLPEGNDERTVEAGILAAEAGLAKITLIGDPKIMNDIAKVRNKKLDSVTIIDEHNLPNLEEYAAEFYELRKHKGITKEEAMERIKEPLYYGAMMVRKNVVDSFVAGDVNTTADVCRAAIRVVGIKRGMSTLSSFFIMILPDESFGEDGILAYADGGVLVDPDENQLSDIAISTAESFKMLVGREPRVAMISFSTKGSATHAKINKVINATNILKRKYPNLIVDGEMQIDAALVPEICDVKAKGSPIAGKANVLIFPDLDSGNVAYKITQRIGKALAFGPILQGLKRPCSDLSRGASVNDILNVVAINVVRWQCMESEK